MSSKIKLLRKLIKGAGIGGLTGYISSRTTSSSAESDINSKVGGIVGAVAGAGFVMAPKVGRIVFRKIRGRIIPVRMK